MNKNLKIALLGCGRIAKRHADLLSSKQIKGAELVAVCDIQHERSRKFGLKYNIPHFFSLENMLQKTDIDVVSILTESGHHAEHCLRVAKFGKHIIVEKPMALRLEDADLMIKSCRENKVKLFIVKQNRFNLPVLALREALDANRFGKLILGTVRVRWSRDQNYYGQDAWRGTWALDGGVLANQASHHVDLLEWMMGPASRVFAFSKNMLAKIEAEDTTVAIIEFENGARGVIEATTATRPTDLEGSLSILGSGGSVEISGFAVNQMRTWNFVDKLESDELILRDKSENPPNVYGFGHKAYYDHVVNCISNKKLYAINGEVGRQSLELIDAIHHSAETGRVVDVSSSKSRSKLGL